MAKLAEKSSQVSKKSLSNLQRGCSPDQQFENLFIKNPYNDLA
jgi:hypothetical protein